MCLVDKKPHQRAQNISGPTFSEANSLATGNGGFLFATYTKQSETMQRGIIEVAHLNEYPCGRDAVAASIAALTCAVLMPNIAQFAIRRFALRA